MSFTRVQNHTLTFLLMVLLGVPCGAWAYVQPKDVPVETVDSVFQAQEHVPFPPTADAKARVQDFGAHYGLKDLRGSWNKYTTLPHRLWSEGFAITDKNGLSEETIEAVARQFFAENEALFQAPGADLALDRAMKLDKHWVVIFNQTYHGLPVEGGRVDLRIRHNGVVSLSGSDFFPGIALNSETEFREDNAFSRAAVEVSFNPDTDTYHGSKLVVLPRFEGKGYVYHLAWKVDLETKSPLGRWLVWVDTQTGKILQRKNTYRFADVSGSASGRIHVVTGLDPMQAQPFKSLTVSMTGGGAANTDAQGSYTLTNVTGTNKTLTAELKGPYANANNRAGTDGKITLTADAGATGINFFFDSVNSTAAERDGFFWANWIHDWCKRVDPNFNSMDFSMPVNVNLSGTCNAYYDGSSINFYREGGGCNNMGTFNDVVMHEYGHGINDRQYGSPGASGDMEEGMADYHANTIVDRAEVGLNVTGAGQVLRTSDNNRRWPAPECGGEVHCVGEVLAGALWHTRVNLINSIGDKTQAVDLCDHIFFFTKYAKPRSMPDFLLDFLAEDDDDGNMVNGTPHFDSICAAWEHHGFTCPDVIDGVYIVHQPLTSTDDDQNDYVVRALVSSTQGTIQPGTVKLYYSLNGGSYVAVTLASTGIGDQYQGSIPAQPLGTNIRYYLTASDDLANTGTAPDGAPQSVYTFSILDIIFLDNFEGGDNGWTHVQIRTQDDWHHDVPDGTSSYDPDTAFSGTNIWGNDLGGTRSGASWDGNYKSSVENYLESPVIDCSGAQRVHLQFRRWLSVEKGQYDQATVEVNGTKVYENPYATDLIDTSWVFQDIDISAIADSNPSVKIRFRLKSDQGVTFGGWNLDDVMIVAVPNTTGTPTPTRPPTDTPTPTPTQGLDTVPPYLENPIPADGAINVSPRAYVTFHLLDDGQGVDNGAVLLQIDGVTVLHTAVGSPSDYLISYLPAQAFTLGLEVQVHVEASDLAGNDMTPVDYTFTVADNDPTETPTDLPTATPTPSIAQPNPPVMNPEPPYTAGNSNEVSWIAGDPAATEFYAEVSLAPNFANVLDVSEWVSDTRYTFGNLRHGLTYYFRAKSRTAQSVESNWSSVVNSAQDAVPPQILLAGYWDSAVTSSRGGEMTLLAMLTDSDVRSLELGMGGSPLGAAMYDDGQNGDWAAGDGVYTFTVPFGTGSPVGNFLLEINTKDRVNNTSTWPYLNIPLNLPDSPGSGLRGNLWEMESGASLLRGPQLVAALEQSVIVRRASAATGPKVALGGYWDTSLSQNQGGVFRFLAYITHPGGATAIRNVEVLYGGQPTGMYLNDDGLNGDFAIGDGVYGFQITFGPGQFPAGQYLLELVARDFSGNESPVYPYFAIQP